MFVEINPGAELPMNIVEETNEPSTALHVRYTYCVPVMEIDRELPMLVGAIPLMVPYANVAAPDATVMSNG